MEHFHESKQLLITYIQTKELLRQLIKISAQMKCMYVVYEFEQKIKEVEENFRRQIIKIQIKIRIERALMRNEQMKEINKICNDK